MAKLTEIAIRVKHGETVYVIDDYEERATVSYTHLTLPTN